MPKIYAPNKEYTGVSAGVSFVKGVGETDKKHLIEWFKSNLHSKIVILIDLITEGTRDQDVNLHSKIVILIALYEEDLYSLYLKLTFLSITFFRLSKL